MGLVHENITLKNATDVSNSISGVIKESEVRQKTVNVLVDTGALMLVINEKLRQELGLKIKGKQKVWFPNKTSKVCRVTESVDIHWKDRFTATPALIIEETDEILLGAIPLEGMDLIVDPNSQKLVGAHGDKAVFRI